MPLLMCPTCRGVWLDRGELEKLMSSAQAETGPPPRAEPPRGPVPYAGQGYGEYGERGEGGEYGERGHGYKRRRGGGIFDIFD